LNTKPTLADPRKPKQFPDGARGAITFNNVTFAYPDSEEPVLHDISFESLPGQVTAFIGSTGSGKSSILNLIPRFFDVTEGSVKVDGIDVRDVNMHDLRARIGYIPQKAMLFSGDIDSNIKFGGRDISDEAARMAAEVAQAADFIEQKPDGIHEPITQGGDNVSGGQRQRLAIARALAGNPDILIFDDSFSALDFRTDAALRSSLRANMSDKNILIVAQRISTIMSADQIIVLDNGRMIAIGRHDDLMRTCPVYRDIAVSQFSESEVNAL
jgi:ATP-binding cassette subfamily B protein